MCISVRACQHASACVYVHVPACMCASLNTRAYSCVHTLEGGPNLHQNWGPMQSLSL